MLNTRTNNSWKEQIREKNKKKMKVQKVRCLMLFIRDPLGDHQSKISYTFAECFSQLMIVLYLRKIMFVKFAKSVTTYKLIQRLIN